MDLLDFAAEALYFDETQDPTVAALINEAAACYADGGGEAQLQKAYARSPTSLGVLVALYRFYYHRHRLDDAWKVAEQTLAVSGRRLGLPEDWRILNQNDLGAAAQRSMTLLRFYLLALKAAGYLRLRLGDSAMGEALLEKLVELDAHDRLGASALLNAARQAQEQTADES